MSKLIKKIEKENEIKLTIKQAVFFEEWLNNGGNGVRASMKAYDTTDYQSAGQIAYENLKKLENPMRFYMEHKGIGMGRISEVLTDALEAEKWNDFTGEKEKDHHIRLKAVERIAKMTGMETEKSTQPNVQVNILNSLKGDKEKYDI